jgi:hypothetical protein
MAKAVKERTQNENEKERADGIKPCVCGHNRWQTVVKGRKWKCRKCGKIREAKP